MAKDYDIVLLLGDNLLDLSKDFDDRTQEGRSQAVHQNREAFGKRFIVLPNFSYGDWEGAAYGNKYSIPAEQKELIIKNKTKAFK